MDLSDSGTLNASRKERILREMAEKYIWWKSSDIALRHPKLIITRVMDIGDYQDVQLVADSFGDDYLRNILIGSEPGALRPRSWAYWHYRLGIATLGHHPHPAPPKRQFSH